MKRKIQGSVPPSATDCLSPSSSFSLGIWEAGHSFLWGDRALASSSEVLSSPTPRIHRVRASHPCRLCMVIPGAPTTWWPWTGGCTQWVAMMGAPA